MTDDRRSGPAEGGEGVRVFRVDRYGWTWLTTSPTPASMQKRLVEAWASGAATEVVCDVRGRRPVRV